MYTIDLAGKTFGQLKVLERADANGYWRCLCSCGNEKVVKGASLRSGNTKSCGCLVRLNCGRPLTARRTKPEPCIGLVEFIDAMEPHFSPMRNFLKSKGVLVRTDGFFYVYGVAYGPYASPVHALAAAMAQCIAPPQT